MTSQQRTTPGVLDRMAVDFSDHDALVTEEHTLTFAESRDEVRRAAAAIIGLGVQTGDKVAIWSPNTWHLEGVADAAVIGVPDLDEQAVIDYTKKHLANFKTPRSVVFAATLPRNPGGKVVKPTLREMV